MDTMTEDNMAQNDDSHLKEAAGCWAKGESLEAGKLIYENIPSNARPKWGARLLKLVLDRSGIESSLVDEVLYVAEREAMWGDGHRLFSKLRDKTLELLKVQESQELTKEEELLYSIVSLAELVAKVTYNATNPDDEFDKDSGWWIVASIRGFVDHVWSDDEFANSAWSEICSCT
jgi:hypothetical protein